MANSATNNAFRSDCLKCSTEYNSRKAKNDKMPRQMYEIVLLMKMAQMKMAIIIHHDLVLLTISLMFFSGKNFLITINTPETISSVVMMTEIISMTS